MSHRNTKRIAGGALLVAAALASGYVALTRGPGATASRLCLSFA